MPLAYCNGMFNCVRVLAYDRALSLQRLLSDLDRVDYGAAEGAVQLRIIIDSPAHKDDEGALARVNATIAMAHGVEFRHGTKQVLARTKHAGLLAQWSQAWDPDLDPGPACLILEDDTSPSPHAWRWISNVLEAYASNLHQLGSFGLQRQSFIEGVHHCPTPPAVETPYLHRLLATWGFVALRDSWRNFRRWLPGKEILPPSKIAVQDEKGKTLVFFHWANAKASGVYGKVRGHAHVWEVWFLSFMHSSRLFTLYPPPLPGPSTLCANNRDPGLNYKTFLKKDFPPLSQNSSELWRVPPFESLPQYSWDSCAVVDAAQPAGTPRASLAAEASGTAPVAAVPSPPPASFPGPEDCMARCDGQPLVTFTSFGRLNNNLYQLRNMLWWSQSTSHTLILPSFLQTRLQVFEWRLLQCQFCVRPAATWTKRKGILTVPGEDAFFNHRPFLENTTHAGVDIDEVTRRLFRSLVPQAPLIQSVGCAMASLVARRIQVTRHCKDPMPVAFGGTRLHYSAVHVRTYEGTCEARLLHLKTQRPELSDISLEMCSMPPQYVRSELARYGSTCNGAPIFIASDWQRPEITEALLSELNASARPSDPSQYHGPDARRAVRTRDDTDTILSTWTDIILLAMARCTIVSPLTSFSFTVNELRRAWASEAGANERCPRSGPSWVPPLGPPLGWRPSAAERAAGQPSTGSNRSLGMQCEAVKAVLTTHSDAHGVVALATADASNTFEQLLGNWACGMRRAGMAPLLWALDQHAAVVARQLGVEAIFSEDLALPLSFSSRSKQPGSDAYLRVVAMKPRVVLAVLRFGFSPLLLDVDLGIAADLRPFIVAHSRLMPQADGEAGADLIVAQNWPQPMLNSGVIFLSAGSRALALAALWAEQTDACGQRYRIGTATATSVRHWDCGDQEVLTELMQQCGWATADLQFLPEPRTKHAQAQPPRGYDAEHDLPKVSAVLRPSEATLRSQCPLWSGSARIDELRLFALPLSRFASTTTLRHGLHATDAAMQRVLTFHPNFSGEKDGGSAKIGLLRQAPAFGERSMWCGRGRPE